MTHRPYRHTLLSPARLHLPPAVKCTCRVAASRLDHFPVYCRVLKDDFNDVHYLMDMVKQVQPTAALCVCVCVYARATTAYGLWYVALLYRLSSDSPDPGLVVLLCQTVEAVCLLCVPATYHLVVFLSFCCGTLNLLFQTEVVSHAVDRCWPLWTRLSRSWDLCTPTCASPT